MSEYQYYEFRTINRQLSADERKHVDRLSSHGHTTATSFSVDYSYGDFKHDEDKVLASHFDVFYYIANWGTTIFKLRYPKELVDTSAWDPYCVDVGEVMQIEHTIIGDNVILTFHANNEDGHGWISEVDALDGLSSLYNEILQGDLRAFYLGWLSAIEYGTDYSDEFDDDTIEPPVPAGLDNLSPSLQEFVDQFGPGKDLLATAALGSEGAASTQQIDLVSALNDLSKKECVYFLHRFLQHEDHIELALKQRLGLLQSKSSSVPAGTRTIGTLLATVEEIEAKRKNAKAAAAEANRKAAMQALADRGDEPWQEIETLINTSDSKAYKEAVKLLGKLSDLAREQDQLDIFESRVEHLRLQYKRRSALMRLMKNAQLV